MCWKDIFFLGDCFGRVSVIGPPVKFYLFDVRNILYVRVCFMNLLLLIGYCVIFICWQYSQTFDILHSAWL